MAGGTQGDVAPYTGLAARLGAAGHEVTIATHEPFGGLVRACGLEFRAIPGDLRELLSSTAFRQWQDGGASGPAQARHPRRVTGVVREAAATMREIGEGIVTAVAEGADLVLISNTVAPLTYHVAEALGIPSAGVYWGPLEPTGDFPPIMTGYPPLGRWGNRAAAQFGLAMMDAVYSGAIGRQRALLGLGAVSARSLRRRERSRRWPIYHGYSAAIVPRPKDWRAGLEVVGYWWPHQPADWEPADALLRFLAAGPPPVLIGFGSMAPGLGERLSQLAIAALRRAGTRGILQSGWAGLSVASDDVLTVGELPHEWLLPRMAAVVHHGGAGTTGAALRAGVPAVPVPAMIDQFFWARRLYSLGASPRPIPLRRLTPESLAEAITTVLAEPRYRAATAVLAERVRAEDGAGAVVAAVDRLLSRRA